jgi:hypothetical protein
VRPQRVGDVGFDSRFAETAGCVADIGDKIALIAYPGEEQDAALRLPRVGSDQTIGYLAVVRNDGFPVELSDLVQTAPRVNPFESGTRLICCPRAEVTCERRQQPLQTPLDQAFEVRDAGRRKRQPAWSLCDTVSTK